MDKEELVSSDTGKRKKQKGEGLRKKRGENMIKQFLQDESGMGVVEIILIIVVLIGLVVIFQTNIQKVVTNIFKKINTGVDKVK